MNRKEPKAYTAAEIAASTPEKMAAEFNAAEIVVIADPKLSMMLAVQIETGRKYLSLAESTLELRNGYMLCVLGSAHSVRSILKMAAA